MTTMKELEKNQLELANRLAKDAVIDEQLKRVYEIVSFVGLLHVGCAAAREGTKAYNELLAPAIANAGNKQNASSFDTFAQVGTYIAMNSNPVTSLIYNLPKTAANIKKVKNWLGI